MDTLKKEKVIDEAVFSIAVNRNHKNESKATFGGYDMEKYAQPEAELEWHDVLKVHVGFWLFKLTDLTLSNSLNPMAEKEYVFGNNAKENYMIVDSGTSFLMMPKYEHDKFRDYLLYEQGIECVKEGS